jgi:hypothetical protein
MPEIRVVHLSLAAVLRRAALALAVAATLAPLLAPPPAHAATYSGFYTDFAAEELMRLTNLDRRALGRSKLKVDQFLVSLARDQPFVCPSNGATYRGRARDMAVRDYMSHSVKGCRRSDGSPYTVQTILRRQGYSTYTGENIGVNNWPDTGASYRYGCSSSGSGCDGRTSTTAPVATVQRMWMQSSGHRYNILAGYDRFGCAAWNRSDGQKYFACIFAKGGPKPIDGTAPTVTGLSGDPVLRRNEQRTFSASFADGFRLSDGSVRIDGVKKRGWAYDLNVTSNSQSYTVDASTLSPGNHTLTWTIRDVAGRLAKRSITLTIGS